MRFRGPVFLTILAAAAFSPPATLTFGEIAAPRARPAEELPKVSRFQRVFVPEGELDAWPKDSWRYVPMDRERFEKLVSTSSEEAASAARITAARYEGTFENNVLRGSGRWRIEANEGGGTISLSDVSLAIVDVGHVPDDPTEEGILSSGDGGPYLPVSESTTVMFSWSARGTVLADTSVEFDLRFPKSLVGTLTLSLPPRYRLSAGTGVCARKDEDQDRNTWRIELGGRAACRMRLIPDGVGRPTAEVAKGSLAYVLGPKGIDLSSEWNIRFASDDVRSLELRTDGTLRLTRVELDRQPCRWSLVSSEGEGLLMRVEVPEAVREGAALLRVEGIAGLVEGSPRFLPRVWMADGAARPREAVRVRVDAPLIATRIVPSGAVQTDYSAIPAPNRGELFEFLCLEPLWRIEVETEFPEPRVTAEEAVSLQFGPGEIQARVKTLFQVTQGRVFSIQAAVRGPWIIDSVQSDTAGLIEDWSAERARRGEERRLTVRLARPLTPNRPVESVVLARRLYSPRDVSLGMDELRPLHYPAAESVRRVMSLRGEGSVQLRTLGDEFLTRLDPDQLGGERFSSFLRSSGTLVFLDDMKAESLQVTLRKSVPRFSAHIECTAGFIDGALAENYEIECIPEATRVERFWVRFSQPREGPLRWEFADGRNSQLEARRLDAAEKASVGAALEGETWEITLFAPRSVPFEIRASRRTPFDENADIALAWLPEAEKAEAFVTVLANDGHGPVVVSSSLDPAIPAAVPSDRYDTARAVFEYAQSDLDSGGLVIRPRESGKPEHPVWAWRGEIDSEFASSGKTIHTARYHLENTGARSVTVTLPEEISKTDVREIRLDGTNISFRPASSGGPPVLTVPLAPRKKHLNLKIVFSGRETPLGLVRRLDMPRIEPDFPVIEMDWIVRFAPGYFPVSEPEIQPGIVQRITSLFGPLAAAGGVSGPEPMFDPDANTGDGSTGTHPMYAGVEAPRAPSGRQGWSAYRFVAVRGGESFQVVRRFTLEAFGYAVLLGIAGVGIGVFRSTKAYWVCGAAACVIACLLVSPVLLNIVSGAFLGFLAVAFSRLLRRTRPPGDFESGPTAHASRHSARHVATALACIAVLLPPTLASAQVNGTGTTPDSGREPPVFPVLFPVADDAKAPPGRVLVPEPLYRELHREGTATAASAVAILSANYDCELVWSADEEEVVPREWRFRYEVKNTAQAAELTLPIKTTEGVIRTDGVRVDGRLTAWRTSPGGMRIPISEPGRHRVEVWLRPKVLTSEETHKAVVGIPPVLSAEATLTVPANGPRVDVASAVGEVRHDRRTGKTHAILGPADSLTLTWKWPTTGERTELGDADATCLFWMHLRPDSVRLDAKISLQGLPEGVRYVDFRADAPLRPADPGGQGDFVWTPREDGGETVSAFRVSIGGSPSRPLSLEKSFFLEGRRGTERIAVPRLVPAGIPVTRSWLAVSVDPRLEMSSDGSSEAIPIEDFAAAWGGETARPPDFAYRMDGLDQRFVEATPRDDAVSVKQETVCECGADSAVVRFRAELDTESPRLAYQMDVPRDVRIDSVSVYQEDVQRSVRWSRDSTSAVNVFLGEAVSGKHILALKGHMPARPPTKVDFPIIRILGASVREARLLLARRFGASVRVLTESGCTPLPESIVPRESLVDARLVRAYQAEGDAPRLELAVEPNAPFVEATLILAPFRRQVWHVLAEIRLTSRNGLLDQIALLVPEEITAVRRIMPAEPHAMEETSAGKRLVIRPAEAIEGHWVGRLEFELKGGETLSRVALPRIEMLPAEVGETRVASRTVVLPTRIGEQALDWDRRYLRPGSFPADFAWPGDTDDAPKAFEATWDDYAAVLVIRDIPKGIATARFADVYVAHDAKDIHGVAVYDIEPAGNAECPLELPEGCELVRAFVCGMPVDPIPRPLPKPLLGERRYAIPLASRSLPQRISLIFRITPPRDDSRGAATHAYPRPAYLQIRDGIVTVRSDPTAPLGPPSAPTLSGVEADLLRLQDLANLIRREAAAVGTPSASDLRWFAAWSRRLVAAARRLDPVAPEAKILLDEIHEIARRWKKEDLWNDICIQSESLSEPRDVWESLAAAETGTAPRVRRFRIIEGTDQFAPMVPPDASFASPALRYSAAAVLAIGIVYLLFALRDRRATKWFLYPHFAGVLFGVLWYALLRPEAAGLAAVGLFTLASLRSPWRWIRVSENSR